MLKSLNIENIAVIEKSNIDFTDGFNVLTGETGAGKSIVIDAINAIIGQRTSKELIRSGCEKATVSAVFEGLTPLCKIKLNEYGIESDDDTILVLRNINSDGRSNCKINGSTVNVSALREICDTLVNIHGQHDNQALLNPENHCGYIDSFGKYNDVIDDYRDCYNRLKNVRKELKSLTTDEYEKQRKIDLLKFQINEIEAAKITVGELDSLIEKRNVARNSEKIRLSLHTCHELLNGNDEKAGAENLLSQAAFSFESCSKLIPEFEKISERFNSVLSEVTELTADIRSLSETITLDADELEKCEQRIDILNQLKRKYGGSEQAVLDFLINAKSELNTIIFSDRRIKELEEISDKLEDELITRGEHLTEIRKKYADIFSKQVCDILKYLEMPYVVFLTDFKKGIYTSNGCDKIEFLISANFGQEPKPLSMIASGGELSRIMLSIKSVLSDNMGADTLIFDEIDTGISGKAADKVGKQLNLLSKSKQVICVTHLAQIASAANNHLLITKSFTQDNTYTNVAPIKGEDRINEIARIISGDLMTDNLYNTAKEMLNKV